MTTRPSRSPSWRDELRESSSSHPSKAPNRTKAPYNSDRPFVRLNLAMTADGKIATANNAIYSFGGPHDLAHLYRLREQSDAILCGATTINVVNADLGPRRGASAARSSIRSAMPLRVVVSGRGHVDPNARLFQRAYGPIVILATHRISKARLRRLQSLAHTVRICGEERVDFADAFRWLRSEWNVRELLCEGGGMVNATLFEADLVDQIDLTLCPWIVGGRKAPTIADGQGVADLADASDWQLERTRRLGNELFLTYRRIREQAARVPRRQRKRLR